MDLPHRFRESCMSKAPGIKLRPSDLVQCDNCWFGKNPSAEDLLEDPAVMENQELSTGTRMEVTHRPRPRPNQDVGCGHSEPNPVESSLCDANTAMKVHQVSSCTEFSFSSSNSDDKFMNQKSPQSSSASNDSEKFTSNTNALLFDNLICKFTIVQRSGKESACLKVLSVNYKTLLVLFLKSIATGGLEKIRIIIFSNRHVRTLILTIGFQHKLLL